MESLLDQPLPFGLNEKVCPVFAFMQKCYAGSPPLDPLLKETTIANLDTFLEVGAGHSALSVLFLGDFACEM